MTNDTRYHRRPLRINDRRGRSSTRQGYYERPRLDPLLRHAFKKIGIPDDVPFRPDAFQIEALEKIDKCDVLVSAPTGAGKTWIATQAIRQYLTKGMKVWYASPLDEGVVCLSAQGLVQFPVSGVFRGIRS